MRVHSKQTFDENTRMIRFLSTLDGQTKRTVKKLQTKFYATTTKTLKKDLEKQLIIADCRSSSAIHKPQMKANEKVT